MTRTRTQSMAAVTALIAASLFSAPPAVAANGPLETIMPAAIPAAPGTLPSGTGINFTPAPALTGITMIQNRDSVVVRFPAVANARDFRVLVQPTGVAANNDGTETVTGGTQFCAGLLQHQARERYVADPKTKFPYLFYLNTGEVNPLNFVPQFFNPPPKPYGTYDLDPPPVTQIEITGVTAPVTVTVEAMDRLCPFPGIIGRRPHTIPLSHSADTDHPGNPWVDASKVVSFAVFTEAQVVTKYGSLIVNGQGWASGPYVQATPPSVPTFAQPAPVNPPRILARGVVTIAPAAAAPPPTKDFFDDFSNASDTFRALPLPKWTYPREDAGEVVTQNSKWTIYGNGYTCCATPDGHGYVDAYIADGHMNTILGDWSQDVLSEVSMFPRKAAHLNASTYLHVTFEVNSFATGRRYWAFTACGSSSPGQTLDTSGGLKEQVVHTTFFYNPTGANPSTAGWNCLQIFNRQGNSNAVNQWEDMYNLDGSRPPVPPNNGYLDLADYIHTAIPSIAHPGTVAAYTNHPESDVLVLVNKPIPKADLPEKLGLNQQVVQTAATSPINVSPLQLDNPAGEVAWFYRVDAKGNPVAPILDDQQLASPRTKYDLYIRNNRIVMYVNGQARLCNDFTTAKTTLKIADAALGFHQVLYHSSGEFTERMSDPDRGAAYHYRLNSPWIDQRSWDNIGFQENTAPPADFNPKTCFVHKSLGPENNE